MGVEYHIFNARTRELFDLDKGWYDLYRFVGCERLISDLFTVDGLMSLDGWTSTADEGYLSWLSERVMAFMGADECYLITDGNIDWDADGDFCVRLGEHGERAEKALWFVGSRFRPDWDGDNYRPTWEHLTKESMRRSLDGPPRWAGPFIREALQAEVR